MRYSDTNVYISPMLNFCLTPVIQTIPRVVVTANLNQYSYQRFKKLPLVLVKILVFYILCEGRQGGINVDIQESFQGFIYKRWGLGVPPRLFLFSPSPIIITLNQLDILPLAWFSCFYFLFHFNSEFKAIDYIYSIY